MQKPLRRQLLVLTLVGLFLTSCGSAKTAATDSQRQKLQHSVGNLSYTPDSAHIETANVNPSSPTTLSAVDNLGYTWTLTIPANALLFPTTVTVTPMANATVLDPATPAVSAAHFSGVVIGPPSLVLLKTASLKLTGPVGGHSQNNGVTSTTAVSAPSTPGGTTVTYQPIPNTPLPSATTTSSTKATTTSTTTASTTAAGSSVTGGLEPIPSDPNGNSSVDGPGGDAQGTYPPGTTPPNPDPGNGGSGFGPNGSLNNPPAVELHCIEAAPNSADVADYVSNAQQPELQLLNALLAHDGSAGSSDAQTKGAAYIHALAVQIEALIASDLNNMNAFFAVADLTFHVISKAMVINDTGDADALTAALTKFAGTLTDNSLKQIVDNHDLTDVPEVEYLGYMFTLLNDTAATTAIQNALRFKLAITETTSLKAVNQDTGANVTSNATVQGTANLEANLVALGSTNVALAGSAAMAYSTAQYHTNGPGFEGVTYTTPPFSADIKISLKNVCTDPKAQITQKPYGTTETVNFGRYGSETETRTNDSLTSLVQTNTNGQSADTVTVSLKTKQPEFANQTFNWAPAGDFQTASLQYILTHVPVASPPLVK